MKTLFTPLVEGGYRALAACTSYTAWTHFQSRQQRQWMPSSELETFRLERLRELLRHAYEKTPFYRDLWRDAGVDPKDVQSFQDLEQLPVVTKPDLIEAQEQDLFNLGHRDDFEMTHTSGTTGPRLYLPFTKEDLQLKYGSYLREFYATGWKLGVPSAAMHYSGHPEFAGRYTGQPDKDNFVLIRKLAFRIAHRRILLEPWAADRYEGLGDLPGVWYEALRRHKPFLLETMDFNLLALYRHIKTHNLPPLRIPATFVLATLAPELKARLEDFFHTKIFNRFGPHEIEGVAFECEHHEGLHVAEDCVHLEILDDKYQPLETGESGHVVITDFDSRVMPLIRYQIGDTGHRVEHSCSCGRTFPLMGSIEGRTRDRFRHADGREIPATELASALQGLPELDLFQALQNQARQVEVRLPPEDHSQLDVLSASIRDVVKSILGEEVDCTVTAGKSLRLEHNGKFCFAKRGEFTL